MYYLRKEPYKQTIPPIEKTDGTIIPKRVYTTGDRAVYKHTQFSKFYRETFKGMNTESQNSSRLYMCKTLKKIMEIRQSTFNYCGEWFGVYDECGKVEVDSK